MNRPAFDKLVDGKWVADNDKARERFFQDATVTNGVVRWKSNNNVPPMDCREQWRDLNLPFSFEASEAAYQSDLAKFVKQYKRASRRRDPEIERERAVEMRAAFGPGETVVDIFSGRKYRT